MNNKKIINKKSEKIFEDRKVKVSHKFIIALSIVSILGFIGIVSETLFAKNISTYIESLWMIIIGLGLVIEANIKRLRNLSKEGITSNNLAHLTTIVIGFISIIAGILSSPYINFQNPSFLAIKGIVSIIAILVIIIQTWIID